MKVLPLLTTIVLATVATTLAGTVTLQQGTNNYKGCIDTYIESIDSAYNDPNYGSYSTPHAAEPRIAAGFLLYSETWATCYYTVRGIVKFDLKDINILDNKKIKKATLKLFVIGNHKSNFSQGEKNIKNGPKNVYKAPYPIKNNTTWANYGDKYEPYDEDGTHGISTPPLENQLDRSKNKKTHVWESFDVTSAVKTFKSNPSKNNGFMVKMVHNYDTTKVEYDEWENEKEERTVEYASANNATKKNRPKLVIEYEGGTAVTNTPTTKETALKVSVNQSLLSINAPITGLAKITIFSISGRELMTKSVEFSDGKVSFKSPTNYSGISIVKISNRLGQTFTSRIKL